MHNPLFLRAGIHFCVVFKEELLNEIRLHDLCIQKSSVNSGLLVSIFKQIFLV